MSDWWVLVFDHPNFDLSEEHGMSSLVLAVEAESALEAHDRARKQAIAQWNQLVNENKLPFPLQVRSSHHIECEFLLKQVTRDVAQGFLGAVTELKEEEV